jgi:hypothetical protein
MMVNTNDLFTIICGNIHWLALHQDDLPCLTQLLDSIGLVSVSRMASLAILCRILVDAIEALENLFNPTHLWVVCPQNKQLIRRA